MRAWAAIAAVGVLWGCASGSAIEVEKPAELVEFTPERAVTMLWSFNVGQGAGQDYLQLGPRLDGDVLYMTDRAGQVSAIRAAGGGRVWQVELDVPVGAAPGVGEGLVLIGTEKGELIALDQNTGAHRWRAALSTEVLAPPTAHGGSVVVQTGDGKLFALAATDGKRQWVFERTEPALSLRGTSSPRIFGQFVIAGFASGKIAALDLRDGRLLWELPIAQPRGRNEIERLVDVDAPVLVVGDALYAASYQGKIVAVDLRSGRINWSREVSVFNAMDADLDYLYLTDDQGMVMALDQRGGTSVWRQEKLRGRRLSAPTVVGGYVAVSDFEGYVHWLARDDGRFVTRFRASGDAVRAPGVARAGVLFVGDQNGELLALAVR
jgi:outer membrane protein assembly factor BamB